MKYTANITTTLDGKPFQRASVSFDKDNCTVKNAKEACFEGFFTETEVDSSKYNKVKEDVWFLNAPAKDGKSPAPENEEMNKLYHLRFDYYLELTTKK